MIRVIFLSGFQAHDDRNYMSYAWIIANDGHVPLEHPTQWLVRIGYLLPLALAIHLVGLNEWGLAAYSFICSLGGFGLLVAIGRMYFPENVQRLAAFLLAIFPLDVLFASHAYPDAPLGFWMVLTLFLFLDGRKRQSSSIWRACCIGISAGIAYLHREDAVFLLGPFFIYSLVNGWQIRQVTAITAGGLCVLAGEAIFWQQVSDDPIYRVHVLLAQRDEVVASRPDFGATSNKVGFAKFLDAYVTPKHDSRTGNDLLEPVAMFVSNQEFGIFYVLIWPIVLFVLLKRKVGMPLAVWVVAMAFSIAYIPIAFPKPMVRSPRYYCSLTIPALLLLSNAIASMRMRMQLIVVAGLGLTSLLCLVLDSSRSAMDSERQLREYIERNPNRTFYVPAKTACCQFFLAHGKPESRIAVHTIQDSGRSNALENARLLFDKGKFIDDYPESDDYIVLSLSGTKRFDVPAGYEVVHTIPSIRQPVIQSMLSAFSWVGVPQRFIKRLTPGEGAVIEVLGRIK